MGDNAKDSGHIIDIVQLVRKLYQRRRLFLLKVWPITFVVSCLIIVSIPRYYTSEARLAPEMAGSDGGGTLSSLAASFGLNLGSMETSDAINPMLYPDLMDDDGFVTKLFSIRVKTTDGEIDTDYYNYLKSYQKKPWWGIITQAISTVIKAILPKVEAKGPSGEGGERSPYWLTEEEFGKAESVRANIRFNVNEKTGIISVHTMAQDPLVAKILADSVQAHLQQFITDYRTNKARIDVEHYEQLAKKTRMEYDNICKKYSRYIETNTNIVMASYQTTRENLMKDMQMKYTTYTSIMAQLEASKAKLQERTPAFTQLKGASVALYPAGPKRMIFVIFMLILVTIVTAAIILRKDLTKTITAAASKT